MKLVSTSLRRAVVRISFSPWGTLLLALVAGGALVITGMAVTSWVFWLVLAVVVLPLIVVEAGQSVAYRRRGENPRLARRELREKTIAGLERRGKL